MKLDTEIKDKLDSEREKNKGPFRVQGYEKQG